MSKLTKAIMAKAAAYFAACWFTLSLIDGNHIKPVLAAALLGTVLSFLLGDLVVLPILGNVVTSLGDGAMLAVIAYIFEIMMPYFLVSIVSLAILAAIIAIFEYNLHNYMESSSAEP
jgi:hypothetical protein